MLSTRIRVDSDGGIHLMDGPVAGETLYLGRVCRKDGDVLVTFSKAYILSVGVLEELVREVKRIYCCD